MTRAVVGLELAFPGPPDGLCLDFANTLYWRGSAKPVETLGDATDLLHWVKAHGAVSETLLACCAEAWRSAPDEEAAAFATAIALREAIVATFTATASRHPPPEPALTALNRALATGPPRAELSTAGWLGGAATASVTSLLAPVIWSWADLLAGPRLPRVRLCANDSCRWLFLDDSKSGNRRWCSMASCGNRAKAHRHYLKRKGSAG